MATKEPFQQIDGILNSGHECRPIPVLMQAFDNRRVPTKLEWLAANYAESMIQARLMWRDRKRYLELRGQKIKGEEPFTTGRTAPLPPQAPH